MRTEIVLFTLCGSLGAAGGALWKSRLSASSGAPISPSAASAWTAPPGAGGSVNGGGSPSTGGLSGSAVSKAAASPAPPAPGPAPSLEELHAASPEDRLPLLVRWLPRADAARIAALAREWYPVGKDSGDVAWQVMVQRWVEVDAPGAFAFARKISAEFRRGAGPGVATPLLYAYRALGRGDPDSALSFLAEEPVAEARLLASALLQTVGADKMREWARGIPDRPDLDSYRKPADPDATVDFSDPAKAAAGMTGKMLNHQGEQLATEWAQKDPAAALAWAQGLENTFQRPEMLAVIAAVIADSDPGKALKIIQSLNPGSNRTGAEMSYVTALAKKDPKGALAWADGNLQGIARMRSITAIAGAQAASDPDGALRLLREQGIGDLSRSLQEIVRSPSETRYNSTVDPEVLNAPFEGIAAKNPAGVMSLLAETGSLEARGSWYSAGADNLGYPGFLGRSIFREWAAKDPAAAFTWAATQPGGAAIAELSQSAAGDWFSRSPEETKTFAASLPEGSTRDGFVRATGSLMAAENPAEALAWAARNGSGSALGEVFGTIAKANPALAATQFTSLPPEVQNTQVQTLTDSLGATAPVSAVQFFQSLSESQQESVKLRDTAMAYVRQDPQAASEWIGTLPPTQAKDTAISGLVDYLIRQSSDPDPEAAAHWAAASLTPDGRDRRLTRVAEAWFQRDPDGAAAAIQATTLDDGVKQTLLNHAPAKK